MSTIATARVAYVPPEERPATTCCATPAQSIASAISGSSGSVAELLGCEKQARQGRRERSYLKSTGATEDAAWRRLSRARSRRAGPEEPLSNPGTSAEPTRFAAARRLLPRRRPVRPREHRHAWRGQARGSGSSPRPTPTTPPVGSPPPGPPEARR